MVPSGEPQISLRDRIISRIQLQGPITFRDFMQAALYDPAGGYYNTERLKIGPAGDYYTSSNVHWVFGAIFAHYFVELWSERALPLNLVEIGAGTGQLAFDILTALRDEDSTVFAETTYRIIETSPPMRARQREKLSVFGGRVIWTQMDGLERFEGIVFSNELVDAMPVHRVKFSGGGIAELFVTTTEVPGQGLAPAGSRGRGEAVHEDDRGLVLAWGRPSTERLANYIRALNVPLTEGQVIEVNLDVLDWLARIAGILRSGYLITIDYGDIASYLYSPERRNGTFRCFYKHRLMDDPLERIGEQDMTASINFTAMMEHGKMLGLETLSYERQSAFLIRRRLIDKVAAMGDSTGSIEDLSERLALKNLFVPGGVSDNFRVLVQQTQARES